MSTPKPFDTYFGGKAGSGTYQTIINQIPPHRVYVEPFIGGGAIFRMKRPAERSLLWDRDPAVVQPWVDAGVPMCHSVMNLLPGAQIGIGNARNLFGMFEQELDNTDTLIYVDPPYLTSTRKSGTRYNFEMDDHDHISLLDILKSFSNAMIMVSGYPSELYNDLLADWRRIEYQSITRSGAMATEVLWMNYPEPTELHDYHYAGANYRERERIAKKVRRHVAKFKALPELERKAILSALINQHQ